MQYETIVAIGQDSHRFVAEKGTFDNPGGLILGGVQIPGGDPLSANSDGDVILHALTNAVSGYTGVNILGSVADRLCLNQGVTDSREYLKLALSYLGEAKIAHVSLSVECKSPRLSEHIDEIRQSIANLLSIPMSSVGITATSGEGLSAFGRGEGIMVICAISVRRPVDY
jgi:2-C-methyl-D-erythritol 2,4-cyclodiphosphate synthase